MKCEKPRKRKKKISNATLLKLWGEVVRARDKKCVLCGRTENVHAHHAIVRSGQSLGARFISDNGITLCHHHHIQGVHGGDKDATVLLAEIHAIIKKRIGQERFAEVSAIGHMPCKLSDDEREEIRAGLKK